MLFEIEAGVRCEQADMPAEGYLYEVKIYETEEMRVEGDWFTSDELIGGELPEMLIRGWMRLTVG